MSLILDALNRADKERSVEQSTPNLQSSHVDANSNNNHIRRWVIEAAIIGSILLVALYFFTRDNQQTINTVTPTEKVIEPKTVVNREPTNTVEAAKTSHSDLTTPVNKSVEKNSQPSEPNTKIISDSSVIDALYNQPIEEVIADPKPTNTLEANTVEPTIDNTESILSSIPLLAEQSRNFQRQIPSIEYSFHAYAEQGGLVILNGNKCKVGTVLPSEIRVIAILQNSLVLEFNGRQFRLLALNSWVNL